jgi:hypothetical protein
VNRELAERKASAIERALSRLAFWRTQGTRDPGGIPEGWCSQGCVTGPLVQLGRLSLELIGRGAGAVKTAAKSVAKTAAKKIAQIAEKAATGIANGAKAFQTAARAATVFHKHHTIPREILKHHLPADVAKAVRGKAGAPNRWSIPEDLHKAIHKGPGGGAYNEAFKQRLGELGRKPTADDVFRIRDDLVEQFGLGAYRP